MTVQHDAAAPSGPSQGGAPARRSRLREYQEQLLERMQAAKTGGAAARAGELGMLIGAERYLLDLAEAGEIVPVGPITAVPLTHPWYVGLSNIRGNLVGIIDVARYRGQAATALGPDSRVVTFAGALGFNCALLAARVYGLRHADDMLAAGARLRDANGDEWTRLDLAALVREERFLHVGV